MPDTQFDRWTRRRFGQAAGALIAAPVLAGAAVTVDAKKKKKKKKKCLKEGDGECQAKGELCNPYGSRCCDCLKCKAFPLPLGQIIYSCGVVPEDAE